jgi:hypothetical protein
VPVVLGKFGAVAKVVARGVLQVVAPGSNAFFDLAEKAIDAAKAISDQMDEEAWKNELRGRLKVSEAELERLGQMIEYLVGPLNILCEKAREFADRLEEQPKEILRALATDPALSQALHDIQEIKEGFQVVQADLRRMAQNQAEAMPVYGRMNRMADYYDELWEAGIQPRDYAALSYPTARWC